MKSSYLGLTSFFILATFACKEQHFNANEMAIKELPHWALSSFESRSFRGSYEFATDINPFYLNLDVDGNCTQDIAAIVVEKASGRKGIAVLQHESDSVQIFGAGRHHTFGGSNWKWLIGWKAEQRLTGGANVPKHKGDALVLFTAAGSTNWMFWDGNEWEWIAQ
ncbi:hypothetical protein [Pontibacter sp. H249]|uniref:hypothetical protein n=1 Tax=Pontibacter sp. H249 TaxID=3133420 RepID=UPI0030BBC49D